MQFHFLLRRLELNFYENIISFYEIFVICKIFFKVFIKYVKDNLGLLKFQNFRNYIFLDVEILTFLNILM